MRLKNSLIYIFVIKCGGNHLGDAKFNYCMEHLPVIPAVVKFDEMKSHTNQNIEKDEFHRK